MSSPSFPPFINRLTLLAITFVMTITISNIIAGKLWLLPFGGVTLTSAVILFPLSYLLVDVIPEVYGISAARKVIWLGFAGNAFAVVIFGITLYTIVPPPFWTGQDAFMTVLGFTPRLLVASFTAFLVGTNVNAAILVWVKRLTNSRFLWIRTISSTIVGEGVDSAIFITLAFVGSVPVDVLLGMIVAQAVFKILWEVVATPFTYGIVAWLKSAEGLPADYPGGLDEYMADLAETEESFLPKEIITPSGTNPSF